VVALVLFLAVFLLAGAFALALDFADFLGTEALFMSGSTAEDSRIASAGDLAVDLSADTFAFLVVFLGEVVFETVFFAALLTLEVDGFRVLALFTFFAGALSTTSVFFKGSCDGAVASSSFGAIDFLTTFFFFILIADLQVDGILSPPI
jgi:hypothetical protein